MYADVGERSRALPQGSPRSGRDETDIAEPEIHEHEDRDDREDEVMDIRLCVVA